MSKVSGIKARGGKELRNYLAGRRLSPKQMAAAKCYDCMGGFADGKGDCKMTECPLYLLMPYRERNDPGFASGTYGKWHLEQKKNTGPPNGKE
jgi:hypothetical protein